MSPEEEKELHEAGEICRKFMAWDLGEVDAQAGSNAKDVNVKVMLVTILDEVAVLEDEKY